MARWLHALGCLAVVLGATVDADVSDSIAVELDAAAGTPMPTAPPTRTGSGAAAGAGSTLRPSNMSDPARFINREISWLRFNERVLQEAANPLHPLLERVRFCSIAGVILDEFYMVRVAGLKGQAQAGITTLSADGMTPAAQLSAINVRAHALITTHQRVWRRLSEELKDEGIAAVEPDALTNAEREWVSAHFVNNIFPQLTPMTIDPAHPFPFLANKGYGLALHLLRTSDSRNMEGLLLFPPSIQRLIRLPAHTYTQGQRTKSGHPVIRFILLEHIISMHMADVFPGFTVRGQGMFRILRDSEMEIDEEAVDLVRTFETALKRRRRGHVIRVTVEARMPRYLSDFLMDSFDVSEEDMFVIDGIVGVGDVKHLVVDDRPDLQFTPYIPRYPERVRDFGGDIFAAIRAKDMIVHHPYETFDVVVQFVRQAARDPNVVTIKQTLYRTSHDSPVVKALIEAAEAGKSVTALIELKARFDEEANIRYAQDMERAGVQVVYGFMDLKTHAKVSLVVRREVGELKSYVHYGTGNYHPLTAKVYTDMSFFTCDPALTRDAAKMFNYMTGYASPTRLEKISVAPLTLRSTLATLIEAEMSNARAGKPAAIWGKMNALVDPDIIDQLYRASQAGVQIALVVRGMCGLRPGVPGLSDNIRVKSIVGRFLEHSRIVVFANGHELPSEHAKVYISSADWMTRNLDWRVESLVPLENPTVHTQVLFEVMGANMNDTAQSYLLQPDGEYVRVPVSPSTFSAHQYFMTHPSLSGRGTHRGEPEAATTATESRYRVVTNDADL